MNEVKLLCSINFQLSIINFKRRPSAYAKERLFQSTKLPNSILQRLACLESGNLHSRNGDALAGIAGIHTHAGIALRNAERSETSDRHCAATLEFIGDRADKSLERLAGGALGDSGGLGNCIDEVLL